MGFVNSTINYTEDYGGHWAAHKSHVIVQLYNFSCYVIYIHTHLYLPVMRIIHDININSNSSRINIHFYATLTVGSMFTVFPSKVPVFLLSFPAALALTGLSESDRVSAGSPRASRLSPLSKPVLELLLPASFALIGDTESETTLTGFSDGLGRACGSELLKTKKESKATRIA